MKTRYIKIASIIEILLGFAMAGLGGFLLFLVFSGLAPAPMGIVGFVVGSPMVLLSIFLIIFGINLWKFKKWAWLPSIIILVLVIALFVMLGFLHPIYFLGSASAVICLVLLVLGIKKSSPGKKKIKSLPQIQIEKRVNIPLRKKINIPRKKFLIITVAILILIAVIEVPKGMITPAVEELAESKTARDCGKETSIGSKDWCYMEVAQETKNSGLCGKVTDKYVQNSCYAIVTNDVSMCEKITNGFKREKCYADVAKEIGDDSLCKKITYIDTKDGCYNEVAQKTKDAVLCEKIIKSTLSKETCYFKVALETKDVILCEKIASNTGFPSRDKCYDAIAAEIRDSSLCEKITDSVRKYICYALAVNDVSMCEKVTGRYIGDGEGKDSCYFGVATKNKDASLCEKIIDSNRSSDIQDQCYMNVARDTNDSGLCGKIIGRNPSSSWKEDCYLNTPCRSIASCVRKFLLGLKRVLES